MKTVSSSSYGSYLPSIPIGDSGERNPELYARIISEFPGRIKSVYIRDVSDERRNQEVARLAWEAAAHAVLSSK
ncbi:MAG: DUF2183 domain-containing protein [Caldilineaceae bacterium]|nr:DUF2183 domain-containing protein [Caldilineaceae bacterium]